MVVNTETGNEYGFSSSGFKPSNQSSSAGITTGYGSSTSEAFVNLVPPEASGNSYAVPSSYKAPSNPSPSPIGRFPTGNTMNDTNYIGTGYADTSVTGIFWGAKNNKSPNKLIVGRYKGYTMDENNDVIVTTVDKSFNYGMSSGNYNARVYPVQVSAGVANKLKGVTPFSVNRFSDADTIYAYKDNGKFYFTGYNNYQFTDQLKYDIAREDFFRTRENNPVGYAGKLGDWLYQQAGSSYLNYGGRYKVLEGLEKLSLKSTGIYFKSFRDYSRDFQVAFNVDNAYYSLGYTPTERFSSAVNVGSTMVAYGAGFAGGMGWLGRGIIGKSVGAGLAGLGVVSGVGAVLDVIGTPKGDRADKLAFYGGKAMFFGTIGGAGLVSGNEFNVMNRFSNIDTPYGTRYDTGLLTNKEGGVPSAIRYGNVKVNGNIVGKYDSTKYRFLVPTDSATVFGAESNGASFTGFNYGGGTSYSTGVYKGVFNDYYLRSSILGDSGVSNLYRGDKLIQSFNYKGVTPFYVGENKASFNYKLDISKPEYVLSKSNQYVIGDLLGGSPVNKIGYSATKVSTDFSVSTLKGGKGHITFYPDANDYAGAYSTPFNTIYKPVKIVPPRENSGLFFKDNSLTIVSRSKSVANQIIRTKTIFGADLPDFLKGGTVYGGLASKYKNDYINPYFTGIEIPKSSFSLPNSQFTNPKFVFIPLLTNRQDKVTGNVFSPKFMFNINQPQFSYQPKVNIETNVIPATKVTPITSLKSALDFVPTPNPVPNPPYVVPPFVPNPPPFEPVGMFGLGRRLGGGSGGGNVLRGLGFNPKYTASVVAGELRIFGKKPSRLEASMGLGVRPLVRNMRRV